VTDHQTEPQGEKPPLTDDELHRRGAMRSARNMVLWTVGLVLAVLIAVVVFAPPEFMQFRLSVLLKLGAGVVATVILAALLMAASFYSARTGHDDGPSGH
jgi:uncharacterized protein YacL